MPVPLQLEPYFIKDSSFEQGELIQKSLENFLRYFTLKTAVLAQGPSDQDTPPPPPSRRAPPTPPSRNTPASAQDTPAKDKKVPIAPETAARAMALNASGICQALAVKWIKMKHKEQAENKTGSQKVTSNERMNALKQPHRFDKAAVRQDETRIGKNKIFTNADSLLKVIELYKLPTKKSVLNLASMTLPAIADVSTRVTKDHHKYYVMSLSCPKYQKEGISPNHAIAFYTSAGGLISSPHVYAFDPNYGEFKAAFNKFSELLRLLMDDYGAKDGDIVLLQQIIFEQQK